MRNSVSTKLSFLFQFESLTSHNAIHSLPVHSPLPRSLPSPSLALCCAISLPHSPPLSISLTLPIQSPSPSSISHHCCRQTLIVPATIDYRYVALLWYFFWFWVILGCVLCGILIILLKLKSSKFTNQDENFVVCYMLRPKVFLAIWLCLCYFLINENFIVFYMLQWLFSH